METKANYTLIGLFTLAVVAGVFGFVYWFQNLGGAGERAYYRVVFDGTVLGLRTGGAVLFNGIRVGEVTGLQLNAERPEEVIALVSIDKSVAVRPDTKAGIEFQGLTGIAAVGLNGGTASLPPLAGSRDNPPIIRAARGSSQDVTQGARDVLRRLDDFIAENQATFKKTLENIETFSASLAKNTERVDHILANLDNLTGGPDGKSGQVIEAVNSVKETFQSVRKLSDNLDKRTADISDGINKFTATGSRVVEQVGRDMRNTLADIDRTVKNIDKNPSRLFFGGDKKN